MNKESLEIWKSYFNKQNIKRINHLFDYTLSDSKNLRSLFYTQGEEKIDMVSVCLEVLQAYFLITDDIMDKSEIRRGKPCLYKVVGLRAMKDAFFLLSLIFKTINECELIGHKLKNKSSVYAALIYANFYTCLGQTEDTLEKKILTYQDIKECYNLNKYLRIVKFKTSYYTTHLPLKLRYIDKEKEFTKEVEEFCFLLGVFMQIQDDYLNFYPEMSGKSGTDVEEKKVTYYSCKLVSKYNEEVVSKYFLGNDFNFIYPFFYELIKNYEEEENEFYAKLLSFKKIEEFDFIMKRVYKRKK